MRMDFVLTDKMLEKEITTKKVLGIPGHVAYAIVLVQMEGVYHY